MKQPDFRLQPRHRVTQAKLFNQLHHIGVADEQVMITSLQLAAAHLKGGRLPAEKRRRLEHFREVSLLGQFVGRGQSRRASADDSYSHILIILCGPRAAATAVIPKFYLVIPARAGIQRAINNINIWRLVTIPPLRHRRQSPQRHVMP